ncbi:MAG: diphthine synthase [Candidatus Micrarchaeota archaeon]|nr:diphthine synthase [Candidatus Micrarchaeota archaeon]
MYLVFVGMGIWNEKDISMRGLEELRNCDVVFAEGYTGRMQEGSLKRLEALIGKKIIILPREEVEEEKRILNEAVSKKVALLVPGDPMISTTHISLKLSAEKMGMETKVVHSSSIITAAIGECGLQVYKLGKPCTLAIWSKGYEPTSSYDVIVDNIERGLHSVVFLDLKGRCMEASEAIEQLLRIDKSRQRLKGLSAVVLSRVGSKEQKITYGKADALLKANLGKAPFILVIPGKLHFVEEEALQRFAI